MEIVAVPVAVPEPFDIGWEQVDDEEDKCNASSDEDAADTVDSAKDEAAPPQGGSGKGAGGRGGGRGRGKGAAKGGAQKGGSCSPEAAVGEGEPPCAG